MPVHAPVGQLDATGVPDRGFVVGFVREVSTAMLAFYDPCLLEASEAPTSACQTSRHRRVTRVLFLQRALTR
jgi:hypothetical protein